MSVTMPVTAADISQLNHQYAHLVDGVVAGRVPLRRAVQALQAGAENRSVRPNLVFDRYTPVEQYQEKIRARAELRGWKIPEDQLVTIGQATDYHTGPLEPTSIKLWLGGDLAYNVAEALAWLKDELEAAGIDLEWYNYLEGVSLSWFPGSEMSGGPSLAITKLDFQTFWDRTNGVVPNEVRPKRPYWPGLEVIWFLALNPQYCELMDGETIPFLLAPGLVVDSGLVPSFRRNGRLFYADSDWADCRWLNTAMVAQGVK